MIMKLKSKDEIYLKLVDKLEKYRMITVIGDEDKAFMILGEINMLKWLLKSSLKMTVIYFFLIIYMCPSCPR